MRLSMLLRHGQNHLLLINRHLSKLRVLLHHLWRLQTQVGLMVLVRLDAGVLAAQYPAHQLHLRRLHSVSVAVVLQQRVHIHLAERLDHHLDRRTAVHLWQLYQTVKQAQRVVALELLNQRQHRPRLDVYAAAPLQPIVLQRSQPDRLTLWRNVEDVFVGGVSGVGHHRQRIVDDPGIGIDNGHLHPLAVQLRFRRVDAGLCCRVAVAGLDAEDLALVELGVTLELDLVGGRVAPRQFTQSRAGVVDPQHTAILKVAQRVRQVRVGSFLAPVP